jgi:hypothetical protein
MLFFLPGQGEGRGVLVDALLSEILVVVPPRMMRRRPWCTC